jgi:hypothetical protein
VISASRPVEHYPWYALPGCAKRLADERLGEADNRLQRIAALSELAKGARGRDAVRSRLNQGRFSNPSR